MQREYQSSISALLEGVKTSAGLEGLAVIDLSAAVPDDVVVCCIGDAQPGLIESGQLLLLRQPGCPGHLLGTDSRPLLACPVTLARGRMGGLLLWRSPGLAAWAQSDYPLANTVGFLLQATLGSALSQPGLDRLTGLPNLRWFLEEADRRAERLDRDGDIATLALIAVDHPFCNDPASKLDQADRVLVHVASRLRGAIRPGDLISRAGPAEFVLWQDGMDHLAAAERADFLCRSGFARDDSRAVRPTLSIGITSRSRGGGESVHTMLQRARGAAQTVRRRGGDSWLVANPRLGCSDQSG